MVIFIDQTSVGDHHMVFNSSMVKIIHKSFPNDTIQYYGLGSSVDAVKSMLSSKEINEVKFFEIKRHNINSSSVFIKSLNYFRKESFRIFSFVHILNKCKKDDWIVLSITTFTSFLWFKILKVFYKVKTIAVLHGEVSFIYNAKNILEQFDAFIHKLIFKIKAPNFYYLTLNKIEKQILIRDGYLKENEVFEIEHPYTNFLDSEPRYYISNSCINIGHIGTLDKLTKNSHLLFEVAEAFKNEIKESKISFKGIGLMTASILPYKNDYVDVLVGNEMDNKPKYLSRAEYELNVDLLDYSIFFYPESEYIFRASGAIADAIAHCKPIICLKHPIFEYMFENGGDIGFMCDTVEGITKLLKKVTALDFPIVEKYKIQVENMKKYQSNFTIENVAIDFKSQMDKIK